MGNLAHAVSLDADRGIWPWRTDRFFPAVFRDPTALHTTLEDDGAGAFGLSSPSCPAPHGSLEAQLAGSPRGLCARGRAVYKHPPGCPRGATLQSRAPVMPPARAPACHPHLRLLAAIAAKGRAVVGWRSLRGCSRLLLLHLSNIQARGLEQGRPRWVKNRNFIARQSSSAGER